MSTSEASKLEMIFDDEKWRGKRSGPAARKRERGNEVRSQ